MDGNIFNSGTKYLSGVCILVGRSNIHQLMHYRSPLLRHNALVPEGVTHV